MALEDRRELDESCLTRVWVSASTWRTPRSPVPRASRLEIEFRQEEFDRLTN